MARRPAIRGPGKPPRERWVWGKAPKTIRGTVPTHEPIEKMAERIAAESLAAQALMGQYDLS